MSPGSSAGVAASPAGWPGAIVRLALLGLLLACGFRVLPVAAAQVPPTATEGTTATPAQVQELLKLLADPAVQKWLVERQPTAAVAGTATPAPGAGAGAMGDMAGMGGAMGFQERIAGALSLVRGHLKDVAAAVPGLPGDFGRAHDVLMASLSQTGLLWAVMLVLLFVACGFLLEWIFWISSAGLRTRIVNAPLGFVRQRLISMVMRLGFAIDPVLAFAIGSIGVFLLFTWPPLLRQLVLGYLMVFLIIRMAYVVSASSSRPAPSASGWCDQHGPRRLWTRGLRPLVGWFAFGWVTVGALGLLGFPVEARRLVAYAMGLVLLGWHSG